MDRATIEQIREAKKNEKNEKKSWKVVEMVIRFDKTCKLMGKCVKS